MSKEEWYACLHKATGITYDQIARMTPYQQWSLSGGGRDTDKEVKFDTQEEYEQWLRSRKQ